MNVYPHNLAGYKIEPGCMTKVGSMSFGGTNTKVTIVLSGVNCLPGGPILTQDKGWAPIIFTFNRPDTDNLIILGVPHQGDIGYHFDPASPSYPECICDLGPMGVNTGNWSEYMPSRCASGQDWTYSVEIVSADKHVTTLSVPGFDDLVEDFEPFLPPTLAGYWSEPVDVYIGDVPGWTIDWMRLDHEDRDPRGLYGAKVVSLTFE